ncbi:hypothetical protein GWG54_15490 [Natronococcus sp. JC468]|uniref:hypothetical protein n=1 Tax=Natronococcus sp. JC468 TaxID=1961921 RepID=UPI00143939D4|nr:hypothetical protein [Natronococcus sp. JC468]NKE37200.1 hypothetical protein [Natronococcus sp. JC468]
MIPALSSGLSYLLYHGYDGTEGLTGFPNIGTWLIFAIILVPVYVMVAAWFLGAPRDTSTGLLGVSYLVGITAQMWIGMFIITMIIGILFYGGMPEPITAPGPM